MHTLLHIPWTAYDVWYNKKQVCVWFIYNRIIPQTSQSLHKHCPLLKRSWARHWIFLSTVTVATLFSGKHRVCKYQKGTFSYSNRERKYSIHHLSTLGKNLPADYIYLCLFRPGGAQMWYGRRHIQSIRMNEDTLNCLAFITKVTVHHLWYDKIKIYKSKDLRRETALSIEQTLNTICLATWILTWPRLISSGGSLNYSCHGK